MSYKTLILLIAAALLAGAAFGIDPDPLSQGLGARPLALGSAFVGLADDGSAMFTNPAGLSTLTTTNLLSMYNSQADLGTTLTCVGIARPELFGGSLGVGLRGRQTTDIAISSTEVTDYAEYDVSLVYSRSLVRNILFGIGLRYISRQLSITPTGLEGANGSGAVIDLGLKFSPLPYLGIGLTRRGEGSITYGNGGSIQPSSTTIGASFKFAGEDGFYEETEQDMHLNFDLTKISAEQDYRLRTGFEWFLVPFFALRLGLDQTPTANFSTAGFGLLMRGLAIDFAYRKGNDPADTALNYFSLSYVGEKEKKVVEKKPVKVYPSPEPSPPTATSLKRVRFNDKLPAWGQESIELLATAGLIRGYPDGTFRPNIKLNRAHFAQLLLTAKNISSSNPAKEVGGVVWEKYPNDPVTRQEGAKLIGYTGNVSRPKDPMTRAEFAVFLARTPLGLAAIKRLPHLED